MDKLSIERAEARARRIANNFRSILSDAEAIAENGGDPSTSTELGNRQTELQDEMEQFIADMNYLASTSDGVVGQPTLLHPDGSFSLTEDTSTSIVTITYDASPDLDSTNATVYHEASDGTRSETTEQFSGTIVTNDTLDVDVSGFSSDEQIVVEWTTSYDLSNVYALPNANRNPMSGSSEGNVPTPDVKKEQSTLNERLTLA